METSIARVVVDACIYGIHIVWVADKELIGENLSKGDIKMADADRCVCCGEIVPEGRQVCPQCENGAEQNGNKKTTYREELIDLIIEAKKTDPKTGGFTDCHDDYIREEVERALRARLK